MRIVSLAIVAVVATISAVLLTPIQYLVAERHALVRQAMAAGVPSVAATLLSPLAESSEPRALNNLGVLRARGLGGARNLDDARLLFARAADRGSARARLNAIMMESGGCGLSVPHAAATAARLARIANQDSAAASLIQDCLYFDATARILPDRDQRSVAAGDLIQTTGAGDALLHSGWALLNLARTTKIPDTTDPEEERQYNAVVVPIARKAMELLFAAAEAGAAGAYEPLGILSMQFGERLGDDALAVRLRDRTSWEWLEVGAEKGDWAAVCRIAQDRINHLRWDNQPYSRESFGAAVALARQCIDRKEPDHEPQWYDPVEWLVVTPRLPRQMRPTLDISATAADLNGLLFMDADRRLNAGATNGVTRGGQ